jgi:UMF1 family MFS transporter
MSFFHFKYKNPREVLGWSFYDVANSAFATTVMAVIYNKYYAGVVAGGEQGTVFSLLGKHIRVPGSSAFSFSVAMAMIVVALTAPLLGAIADFSGVKKRFLFGYCLAGSIFTALLSTVGPGDVVWGGLLFMCGLVGFSGGNVFYNALLPEIAAKEDLGKVSGIGWALGYIGGGLCLLVNLCMLQYPKILGFREPTSISAVFPVVGIWWFLFAQPTFLFVKERAPRQKRPANQSYFNIGVARLRRTFRQLHRFRELWKFLLAYFLFNDGIEMVIIMAAIFGDQTLHMTSAQLITFFLMVQGVAFFGAMGFGWLVDWIGNKKTLIITLSIWTLVVLWAYFIGWFTDPVKEYYLLGILVGLVLGGSQSSARSLQASFIPVQNSAEFFSFFAISDKFASVLGPLTFGLVTLITGSLRTGILMLVIFFLAGLGILLTVDESKGRGEAMVPISEIPPFKAEGTKGK